jgi:hypothetical protein
MSGDVHNRRREQLRAWFEDRAPSFAGPYAGAVRMIEDEAFPGRLHFIAHAARDILNRLPDLLDPQVKPKRVEYDKACDEISKHWRSLDSFDGDTPPPGPVSIDFRAAGAVDSLVAKHLQSRGRASNAELLFRHLMRHEPSKGDVNLRLVRELKRTQKWFVAHAHLDVKPRDFTEEDLQIRFRSFESMLHSLVGDFFTTIEELDNVLDKANQQ